MMKHWTELEVGDCVCWNGLSGEVTRASERFGPIKIRVGRVTICTSGADPALGAASKEETRRNIRALDEFLA